MEILRAARFLLALGYRLDRRRLVFAITVTLVVYAAAPLAALALAGLVRALIDRDAGSSATFALLAPGILTVQLMGNHFGHLCYSRLYEHQRTAVDGELVSIVNAPTGIEHEDDPEFADTLELVRGSVAAGTVALESLLNLMGLVVQTLITIVILVSVQPALAVLPLFAVPAVLLDKRAQVALERARERYAEPVRLSNHLVETATDAATAIQIRIFSAEEELLRLQRGAWDEVTRGMWRAHAASAGLRALGHVAFAVGYGGAVLLVVGQGLRGDATTAGLILVVTLALQVNLQISAALGQLADLQLAGHFVERLDSLRGYAKRSPSRLRGRPAARPRRRLSEGITLDGVSFAYLGQDRLVLDDVSLHLAAGRTVALVGENGAGKSTLVKLLCGLYAPTSGRILVDGVDLAEMSPDEWRRRVAALFQDFVNIEFSMRESVGLGEVALLDDEASVNRAVHDAGAGDLLGSVPDGLDGVLGSGYQVGTQLSGGQWQRLALARSLMRRRPLLLVLDEPAAALDADAEHSLFERYASSSSLAAAQFGGVTLLISHRFSTVAMADAIAVLDGGRLRECGSHDELMAGGGLYSELYWLQARAYS